MFRERILEEKKRLNLTAKAMSTASKLHTPEETISRVLNAKKTQAPRIDTVLDIGATVGLQPYEIFMDSTLAAEFKVFLELKSKNEESEVERIRLVAENETLKTTNIGLSQKIEQLEMKLEHMKEIIENKDELLALYKCYKAHFEQYIKKGEI
jgi:hypothetical protein